MVKGWYCCIFICDFIAKVAIVNGRMCSADTEHLHPSKVTVQLGEWLQEKWFFCPISLIFCISSKLTAHEWFDFKLLILKEWRWISLFLFSNDSKIFCIIFLLKFAWIYSSSNAVALQTLLNHAPCLIYVDIYALSNDAIFIKKF